MTNKIYVVSELQYQYNDEYHTVEDYDCGRPFAARYSREEAERLADEKTKEALRGWLGSNIQDYVQEPSDLFPRNTPSFVDSDLFYDWDTFYKTLESIDFVGLSDESLDEVIECMGTNKPYIIEEVELS